MCVFFLSLRLCVCVSVGCLYRRSEGAMIGGGGRWGAERGGGGGNYQAYNF